ncbi:MAG TPA: TadE/TadG family type IV pilus assembly protein [Terracidiphilus sp.]
MLRRLRRDRSGAALVEFALCSVVFMMMTFGLIEGCFALYSYNFVSDAARWGARYAVVRGANCSIMPDCGITSAQMQTALRANVFPGINSNNLTASVTWYSASTSQPTTWTVCGTQCNSPGNAVNVHVSYSFPLGIPFWRGRTLGLSSTSQMVISN